MSARPLHPRIFDAFAQAGSSPSAAVPRLMVGGSQVSDLGLNAIEGPFRGLGYMTLPRLTLAGDPLAYFSLGGFLINSAWRLPYGEQTVSQVKLLSTPKSSISSLLLKVWKSDSELEKTRESNVVELDKELFWLSPLSNHGLDESDLPVAGVIRDRVSGLPTNEAVATDGSVMYLCVSDRGAIALGKTLILFAICSGAEIDVVSGDQLEIGTVEFVQFEHDQSRGGVGRMSYEVECLMSDSFASQSLFFGA